MKLFVPFHAGFQYECLKKPSSVSKMPLRWTYIGYWLYHEIFCGQRVAESLCLGSYGMVLGVKISLYSSCW